MLKTKDRYRDAEIQVKKKTALVKKVILDMTAEEIEARRLDPTIQCEACWTFCRPCYCRSKEEKY